MVNNVSDFETFVVRFFCSARLLPAAVTHTFLMNETCLQYDPVSVGLNLQAAELWQSYRHLICNTNMLGDFETCFKISQQWQM